MYYLESSNGDVTFKVKGVRTVKSNIKYKYSDLVNILLNRLTVKFDNQQQFHSLDKKLGSGVIVKEGLSKEYTLLISKRTWEKNGKYLQSKPLTINQTTDGDIVKISLDSDVTLIKTMVENTSVIPTPTSNTKLSGSCTQVPSAQNNSINFYIPYREFDSEFERV
jgi:hypothetical protein